MASGNARADIFLEDSDHQAFIDNLGRVYERFDWTVWAWCLMGNHYHLLIETREPTLSKGMRGLSALALVWQTRMRKCSAPGFLVTRHSWTGF